MNETDKFLARLAEALAKGQWASLRHSACKLQDLAFTRYTEEVEAQDFEGAAVWRAREDALQHIRGLIDTVEALDE